MSPAPPSPLRLIARQGAALLFARAVQEVFIKATGEQPKGHPLHLVARLVKEERLTPEATLHLVAIADAFQQAGGIARGLITGDAVREQVTRIVPAAERLPFWQRR